MHREIAKVLVSEQEIEERVKELGKEILASVSEDEEIMMVILLKGALVFATDLFRAMPVKMEIECLNVSSYKGGMVSSGKIEFLDKRLPEFSGKRVIVVDDIFDTGLTMQEVCRVIIERGARYVVSCVLLEKEGCGKVEFKPDHVGFVIGDEFVVGYGLDFEERFRNLPYVGVMRT